MQRLPELYTLAKVTVVADEEIEVSKLLVRPSKLLMKMPVARAAVISRPQPIQKCMVGCTSFRQMAWYAYQAVVYVFVGA